MGKRPNRRDEPPVEIEDTELTPEEEKNRRQKKVLNYNFKLKQIKPLTKNQDSAFHGYWGGKNLLLHGMAGTGKTYIAFYLALNDLLRGMFKRIVIVRSAVTTRDQGFLPGTLAEKMALYEAPYRDIFADLLGRRDGYDLLKKKENLDFMSTSFIRGITLDDAIIIIDEVQNLTDHEINSVLTRVGNNSKVIICGDFRQDDLKLTGKRSQESGIINLLRTAEKMSSFDIVEFKVEDIVRSGFVKEYIIARHNCGLD